MAYDIGGGGGKSPVLADNVKVSLSKPYDLTGQPSAEMIRQINEMFELLFVNLSKTEDAVISSVQAISNDTSDSLSLDSIISGSNSGTLTGSGLIQIDELSLTVAQLQSLGTTPVRAIAGITNKVNIVVQWIMQQQMGADAWSVGPTITLQYAGAAQAVATSLQITNTANVKKTLLAQGVQTLSLANNFNASGVDVNFTGADRTGGSGSYDFAIAYISIDAKY